jgi:hypothetical protein
MKSLLIIGVIPLFAGFLFAQQQSRTETTTTRTTWNGTLIDAACQNTHTEHREASTKTNPDQSVTTKTESSHSETVDCPVTTTTTTFGLLTSDGRYIRFDQPSNTRVVEVVRTNKSWSPYLANRTPLKVRVVGAANGDVAVVQSIDAEPGGQAVIGEASRVIESPQAIPPQAEVMFDVRYHDDRGKLIVNANGLSFEDISNADHSRSWSYAQVKELKRDNGNEIKIHPYSGDTYEFHVAGTFMNDTVYNMIADRIIASRGH